MGPPVSPSVKLSNSPIRVSIGIVSNIVKDFLSKHWRDAVAFQLFVALLDVSHAC